MSKMALVALATIFCSPLAFGQTGTCADPIQMPSNMTITGSTCGGQAGINMGGSILPHYSKVYTFVYQDDAGAGNEPDQIVVNSGPDMNAVISTSCTTAPVGGAAVGFPSSVETLTPGQTYVVAVTTDPSVPVPAGGPICEDFNVSTDTLPVKLQSFSVQ